MSQTVRADVLIIGAGIMGASCAFRLSVRGLKVAVLEAQSSPAMGSTGRSHVELFCSLLVVSSLHLL